ncbi:Hypothetical protein SMAX5B_022129 [Scophthalmus maximus]|uniref:Uncharacterized protein n=1 Tax=Scophthalmus maximus TaxID=52904 RepID=A0A2U9CTS3_SCOMX|nr:Hypothetical protein SMAX5B_022129 [Scophthalmus maximus]
MSDFPAFTHGRISRFRLWFCPRLPRIVSALVTTLPLSLVSSFRLNPGKDLCLLSPTFPSRHDPGKDVYLLSLTLSLACVLHNKVDYRLSYVCLAFGSKLVRYNVSQCL